jgi:hypothetical protein
MTEQLPKEVRVKIANLCFDGRPHDWSEWSPDSFVVHRDILTRTVARGIKAAYIGASPTESMRELVTLQTFADALATDDTNALERLLAEMKGWL